MNAVDYIHYALGWAFLIGMLITALWSLWSSIAPNVGRIVAALYGRPVTPAAPATPHVASTPSHRDVGAAAAPATRLIGGTNAR